MDRHQTTAYPVRLPAELRGRLKELADANDRSLHREIVRRLEESVANENAPELGPSEALDAVNPV